MKLATWGWLCCICVAAAACAGCGSWKRALQPAPSTLQASVPVVSEYPIVLADRLPNEIDRAQLADEIVRNLQKRVMGRREAWRDVARVAAEVSPLVAEAATLPEATEALRRIARDCDVTVSEARRRWIALQEADLLLESGGNPDAVSPSQAVGVAQWLAGTARAHGLPVAAAAGARLTARIDWLRKRIAWLEYLVRPDADPHTPGAPAISPDSARAALPGCRQELAFQEAKRRRLDARYDPRRAIFAQTRYLLKLYPRFPCVEWLFQAYHGGEGGVRRMLKAYYGKGWPGSTAAAIRRYGRTLGYEEVYLNTTPLRRRDAFSYLYGRSDDHRYYWWKLRAAQKALALYHESPGAFRSAWEALLPGRAREAVWYPAAPAEALSGLRELEFAVRKGRLVSVPPYPEYRQRAAPFDTAHGAAYRVLRPEACGALLLLARAFRNVGGTTALPLGDLTLTQEYAAHRQAARPPKPADPPLPPGPEPPKLPETVPPADFDFHLTGLVFDILKPPRPDQSKLLEYVLGYCADRGVLAWQDVRSDGERRYHVAPNPVYARVLATIAATGRAPDWVKL